MPDSPKDDFAQAQLDEAWRDFDALIAGARRNPKVRQGMDRARRLIRRQGVEINGRAFFPPAA